MIHAIKYSPARTNNFGLRKSKNTKTRAKIKRVKQAESRSGLTASAFAAQRTVGNVVLGAKVSRGRPAQRLINDSIFRTKQV